MTLLLLFAFAAGQPALAQAKVALLVESGIESYPWPANKSFVAVRLAEQELYKKAGYKVIELGWGKGPENEPTAQNLNARISELHGVKDFALTFIGHGNVKNVDRSPHLDTKRFPPFSAAQNEISEAPQVDVTRPVQFYILDDDERPTSFIGTGDIKTALENLKAKNVGVETTLKVENCFGGNVARDLSELPQTQTFAASPRLIESDVFVYSSDYSKWIDFVVFFDRELEKGKTYNQAFLDSQHEMIDALFSKNAADPEGGLPRNQMAEVLLNFCEKSERKTEAAANGCASCKNSDPLTDISKRQAFDAAIEGATSALTQLRAIRNSSACRANKNEFLAAVSAVKKRAKALIRKTNKGWKNAVAQLTEKDENRIVKLEMFQNRFPNKPANLEELKKILLAAAKTDPLTVLSVLSPHPEKAKKQFTEHANCGLLDGALLGETYIMTPSQAQQLGEKAMGCIESSNADQNTKNILAMNILNFTRDVANITAHCKTPQQFEGVFHDDLTCAAQFKASANEADWQRLIEAYKMGNLRLL